MVQTHESKLGELSLPKIAYESNSSFISSETQDLTVASPTRDELSISSASSSSMKRERFSVSSMDDAFGDSPLMNSSHSHSSDSSSWSKFHSLQSASPSDSDDDFYGWFDAGDDSQAVSQDMRTAWMDVISKVSTEVQAVEPDVLVLNEWHNPQPSLSLKLSRNELSKTVGYGVSISSCVSGLRICQYSSGEIRAEFQFVFCYGSISYNSWKPFSEFKKLADILQKLHQRKPIFNGSLSEWRFLAGRKRWFRCLDIRYLVEKSIYLGRFMEALLNESPSPGLILAFVKNNRLQSLPSW